MSDAPEPEPNEQSYDLEDLRKRMTSFLAQHISFSVFQTDQVDKLRQQIRSLVSERLALEKIKLPESDIDHLVQSFIDGLPKSRPSFAGLTDQPEAVDPSADEDLDQIRTALAQDMMQHVSNDLFEPGHERALARRVAEVVDEKIAADGLKINVDTRDKILRRIYGGLGIPDSISVPDAPGARKEPEATPPGASPEPSPQAAPPPPESQTSLPTGDTAPAPPKPSRTSIVRISNQGAAEAQEEVEFDDDFQTKLFLTITPKLNPTIIEGADQEAARQHIREVVLAYGYQEDLDFEDSVMEDIINSILGGTTEIRL
jgi:hypothetical protein